MDKTVIILIGAGVCCVVIGIALFVKLASQKSSDDDDSESGRRLLDDEYMENFQECFDNTGNIEDTLDQLANIYMGNQYMYNLIISAIEYIRDEQGDYETALDKINVDSDMAVMRMHNAAIKKALNLEHSEPEKEPEPDNVKTENTYANDKYKTPANSRLKSDAKPVKNDIVEDEEEEFDEDEEDEPVTEPEEEPKPAPKRKLKKKKAEPIQEEFSDDEDADDEDLDGFKIG